MLIDVATFALDSITGERLIEMIAVRIIPVKGVLLTTIALREIKEAITQEVTDEFVAWYAGEHVRALTGFLARVEMATRFQPV